VQQARSEVLEVVKMSGVGLRVRDLSCEPQVGNECTSTSSRDPANGERHPQPRMCLVQQAISEVSEVVEMSGDGLSIRDRSCETQVGNECTSTSSRVPADGE